MYRLLGFLVIFALTAGGMLFYDFRMSPRWSGREADNPLTLQEYLDILPDRVVALAGSVGGAGGSAGGLATMLPKAPEGWTVRPVAPTDVDDFLPKAETKADRGAVAILRRMTLAEDGQGAEVAAATYEKGERKVIIRAVRYPDSVFTSAASLAQRSELQGMGADFRGTEFGSVRGLDLGEDLLPDGFRGRYFFAEVGAQIHLRILTSKRMSNTDLLPFLETLNVKAMNAGVVDKVDGLGEVPVIVLVSELEDAARDAYLADLAVRKAARAERQAASLAAAEAEAAAATEAGTTDMGLIGNLFGGGEATEAPVKPPEKAAKPDCTTNKDGVKRCKVGSSD